MREKDLSDFVTEADEAAESIIIEQLLNAHPESSILGEETGDIPGSNQLRWIVDPLDGTANYLRGGTRFSVSIAATVQNEPVAGVVYDPVHDEMFSATTDSVAMLNGRPLTIPDQNRELGQLMLVSGIAHRSRGDYANYQAIMLQLMKRGVALRRTGSAALDLCDVAAGRVDAHLDVGLQPWDVTAGSLIAMKAGSVRAMFPENLHFNETCVLHASSKVAEAIVALFRPESKFG